MYNIKKIQSVNLHEDQVFNSWKLERKKEGQKATGDKLNEKDMHNRPSFKIELEQCKEGEQKKEVITLKDVKSIKVFKIW